ncbi:MAG: hypothetical protein FJ116_10695, partial [Deltaproteobacteria bacterium]|nr:hypothetical protein [Deltaproteobacteria bacterium]
MNRQTPRFFFLALIVASCSFNTDSGHKTGLFQHIDSRNVKRDDFDDAIKFDKACVTIKGVGVDGSSWTQISKDPASNPTTLSVGFTMPGLLGGYTYTISAYAVDTDNASIENSVTQSPCPADLPSKAGWARLGKTTIKAPEKSSGTLDIPIPFDFYEPLPPSGRTCSG